VASPGPIPRCVPRVCQTEAFAHAPSRARSAALGGVAIATGTPPVARGAMASPLGLPEPDLHGRQELRLTPLELLERLARFVPPPRIHPHKTAGVGEALGLDILSAKDAQASLPQDDPIHLGTAAQDRRIMVTYNRNDFLVATRDAFSSGGPHAGLLILMHKLPRDPTRVAHALARWVEKRKEQEAWPMQEYEMAFLSYSDRDGQ
jgi:hypothetical protein